MLMVFVPGARMEAIYIQYFVQQQKRLLVSCWQLQPRIFLLII